MCGHGMKGHALVTGVSSSGWWLDLILKVISNLDDAMVLYKLFCNLHNIY